MDPSRFIEEVAREYARQEQVFSALRDVLNACDPDLQIAIPTETLATFEAPPAPNRLGLAFLSGFASQTPVALYRAV